MYWEEYFISKNMKLQSNKKLENIYYFIQFPVTLCMMDATFNLQLYNIGNCKCVDVHFPFPVTQISKVFLKLCYLVQLISHNKGQTILRCGPCGIWKEKIYK